MSIGESERAVDATRFKLYANKVTCYRSNNRNSGSHAIGIPLRRLNDSACSKRTFLVGSATMQSITVDRRSGGKSSQVAVFVTCPKGRTIGI